MGKKGPLEFVTPEEFIERTALTLSSRSGSTVTLDSAYRDYFHNPGSTVTTNRLYDELTNYKAAHGGFWNLCKRNVVSGGLLEYMHNALFHLKRGGPSAAALAERAAKNIKDMEIPHTRFGVLYLLANVKLETDKIGMVIDTAGAFGDVIGASVTTNFSALGNDNAVRAVGQVMGQDVKASHIATASTIGAKGIREGVNLALKSQASKAPSATGLPTSLTALESAPTLSDSWDQNRYLGFLMQAGAIPGVATAQLALEAGKKLAEAGRWVWAKLKEAFDAVCNMIKKAWHERYDIETAAKLGALLKKGVTLAMDLVMKNAVPFLGDAIDLGTGLLKTVREACTRIASWADRRHIHIHSGHPQEIANAIEHQMSLGICAGVAESLKGAGKLAIGAFLPGLGSLVSAVISAIEWLIKLISRIGEELSIERFLLKAQGEYDTVKRRTRAEGGVFDPSSAVHTIVMNGDKFTEFFNDGCKASALIPMLTLNSGICGSLMTLVDMFAEGTQSTKMVGARNEFDIGNDFFTRLKRYGVKYMRESGFSFSPLVADDKLMKGYLDHAQGVGERQSHVEAGTWAGRLVAAATA